MGQDAYGTEGYSTGEDSGSAWGEDEEEEEEEERECGFKYGAPIDGDAVAVVDELVFDKQSRSAPKARRLLEREESESERGAVKR